MWMQATIDYYLPHLTFKSLINVSSAPVINASVTTGWNDLTFGGQGTFDTAKNETVESWSAAIGEPSLTSVVHQSAWAHFANCRFLLPLDPATGVNGTKPDQVDCNTGLER